MNYICYLDKPKLKLNVLVLFHYDLGKIIMDFNNGLTNC